MFRPGRQMRVTNGARRRFALLAAILVAGLLPAGCFYEPQQLDVSTPCCKGGIDLEAQLAEADATVSIVWSGQLEYLAPPPPGTDLDTNPDLPRSFNETCENVRVDGYTATCNPIDGLRAGGWTLLVHLYREDETGNIQSIAGSPFTCQIDVPSAVDASGNWQPERRARLRITEGTRASDGCFPTRPAGRTETALIALYDFEEGEGTTVFNRLGDSALDLILQRGGVPLPDGTPSLDWQDGYLNISTATLVATTGPATAVTEAMQASNELTVEAWIRPAETTPTLSGGSLARIVSLSVDTAARNFTLGQEGSGYRMRVRRETNPSPGDLDPPNGIPAAQTPDDSAITALTHIVATYDETDTIRIYINGNESATLDAPGDFSDWVSSYRLTIGDELAGGTRAWLGEYHLVAIYAEALSPEAIEAHLRAGPFAY